LSKHSDVDHEAQLTLLREATSSIVDARFWEVDCLGPCERSNVVVVRSQGQRTWLGGMLETPATEALATWISGGARHPLPEPLRAHEFPPET